MRLASRTILALSASAILFALPFSASAQVRTRATARIEQPAGVSVVTDVISQARITVRPAAPPPPGAPGSISSVGAETLQLSAPSTELVYASGMILSQEAVSVSVDAIGGTQNSASNSYEGVLVVVAQYN